MSGLSKVVFVGNVPYNMAEEQLIDVFKSVGQVVGFRLVFDRDTGKPKGYGFCEFSDHETALSAVRNLNGQELGGRPLRIDLADSDPFLEGKTTVRGELIDGGETRAQWREREREHRGGRSPSRDSNAFLASLPQGVPVPLGSTALDTISQMLATANPGQILEVLAQMKAFVITHPEQARALLIAHPQLGYALFQALLLNKIVDPAVLQRMLAATSASGSAVPPQQPQAPLYPPVPPVQHPPFAPPMAVPPTSAHHAPPPVHTPNMYQQHAPPLPHMQQAPPPPYYRPPPPVQSQPMPQAPPAPQPEFNPAQRDMLMQVLSLTPEQINSLPPTERDQIQQLRKQFLGSITT